MTFDEFLCKYYPDLAGRATEISVDVNWLRRFWERATQPETENIWSAMLRYNHKGLGNQFASLGEIAVVSYDEAKQEAERRGTEHVKMVGEDDILGWDVKVRPVG